MNLQTYEKSVAIAKRSGFDLSDDAIKRNTTLPPLPEWKNDKKLSGFLHVIDLINDFVKDEKQKSDLLFELETAIKGTRSAAMGAIRGHLFEKAVETLAIELGCTVQKNVNMPDLAAETIDYIITLKDGAVLYCMCQIDLWGGGQQTNRSDKYLKNNKITSIVYNLYDITPTTRARKTSTTHELLSQAYASGRLMWLADLDAYIRERNEKFSSL